jgi:hypothetical protein
MQPINIKEGKRSLRALFFIYLFVIAPSLLGHLLLFKAEFLDTVLLSPLVLFSFVCSVVQFKRTMSD